MSPILLRPVREQLEHDRVIRALQAKLRRRFEVGINVGSEQNVPVRAGPTAHYPDVVLLGRGQRLGGVIEVETGESVNNLEAMAQWVPFGKLTVPFHLYVPAGSVEVARRLCADHQVLVDEVWTYHPVGDQIRFTLVDRHAVARPSARRPARTEARRPGPPKKKATRRPPPRGSRASSPRRAGAAAKAHGSTRRK